MAFDPAYFENSPARVGRSDYKWGRYAEGVIPLWVADMDFECPPAVKTRLERRIAQNIYPYEFHHRSLKEAISLWLEKKHAWKVDEQDILLFPGVVANIHVLLRALVPPGKDIVVFTPIYPPFLALKKYSQYRLVEVPMLRAGDEPFQIDFPALDRRLGPRTGLILTCNPHNPTGRAFNAEELKALHERARGLGIPLCSDEIWADMVFPPKAHLPLPKLLGGKGGGTPIITLMAPSKTFNIPGMGLSFAVVEDPHVKKALLREASGIMPQLNSLGMEAAEACYREGWDWHHGLLDYLKGNRDKTLDFIKANIPLLNLGRPEATFLMWLHFQKKLSNRPQSYLLERARVALSDGGDFGAGNEEWVRLNFACPRSRLLEALDRIQSALA